MEAAGKLGFYKTLPRIHSVIRDVATTELKWTLEKLKRKFGDHLNFASQRQINKIGKD